MRGAVTSPTFVIARVHPSLADGPALVHVDAYRLGDVGGARRPRPRHLARATRSPSSSGGAAWPRALAEDRLEVEITARRTATTRRRDAHAPADRAVGARWADVDLRPAWPARNLVGVLLAFDTATPAVTVALHDGERVVASHTARRRAPARRAARARHHRGPRRGLGAPAGRHRDRRRRRARAVHRAAGRPGHRAHARRSRSTCRSTASARSTCSPPQAVDEGAVRPSRSWWPPTRGARRSTGRRTTRPGGASTARTSPGRPTWRPTVPVVGAGALLYPECVPARRRPRAPRRRRAGPGGHRRARRAARPGAAVPAPPGRGRAGRARSRCRDAAAR